MLETISLDEVAKKPLVCASLHHNQKIADSFSVLPENSW
jgi:hypothetical protein